MRSRQNIESHFRNYGFKWEEGVPIVSTNYKLLFNISGGVVFEDVIDRGVPPKNPRIISIQTCLRTDDWENIGISGRHHLAFDMLGHFSLYEGGEQEVKELMIETAWRYLTDCAGISSSSLSATVHPQDSISQRVWSGLSVRTIPSDENVSVTPNRGRCGLRTEIVWRNPNTGKEAELWNLVFTQFQGERLFVCPLEKIAADSGASIDGIVTASECVESDYGNSLWKDVVASIAEQSAIQEQATVRRLSDLGKAAVLLLSQGLKPGNKAAEYVLRKIIREAYLLCIQASIPVGELAMLSCNHWIPGNAVRDNVALLFSEEVTKFEQSLSRGAKEYAKLVFRRQGNLSEEDIEYLSSTFGYPKALIATEESKRKRGMP